MLNFPPSMYNSSSDSVLAGKNQDRKRSFLIELQPFYLSQKNNENNKQTQRGIELVWSLHLLLMNYVSLTQPLGNFL